MMSLNQTTMRSMTRKSNPLNILYFIIFYIILSGIIYYTGYNKGYNNIIYKTDTIAKTSVDTFYVHDTIKVTKLEKTSSEALKKDTLVTMKGDTIEQATERTVWQKRHINGRDTADVTVYATGIDTSIDSVAINLNRYSVVQTNTLEITRYVRKDKKFSIGLQAGYGVGLQSGRLEPFIGVGVSYRIW